MVPPASARPGSSAGFVFCSLPPLGREILSTDWGKENCEAEMLILPQWAEVLQMAASARHANSRQQGSCQVATAAYCYHHAPTPSAQMQKKYHLSTVGLRVLSKSHSRCHLAAVRCTRSLNRSCLKMASSLENPWAREGQPSWQSPSSPACPPAPQPVSTRGSSLADSS